MEGGEGPGDLVMCMVWDIIKVGRRWAVPDKECQGYSCNILSKNSDCKVQKAASIQLVFQYRLKAVIAKLVMSI